MNQLPCRLCGQPLQRTFVDLGMSPPCESYVTVDCQDGPEVFHPLHVRVCDECLLVQLPAYVSAQSVFGEEYAYFSSYSTSWVEHARRFVAQLTASEGLGPESFVVEVASNDGYLLQHFVRSGVPVLGIEPAPNVAEVAVERGVPTLVEFLGRESGAQIRSEYGPADLVCGNNVFAHVPDIRDFAAGLRELVSDTGLVTLEFPHLLRLIQGNQYDTIYHEHFSYLSLLTASRALSTAGLTVTHVEELPTHGGSIRVHARPVEAARARESSVDRVLEMERTFGLHSVEGHVGFSEDVSRVKRDLLSFLVTAAEEGRRVAAYGAPGKGNTLLNHCGIRTDLLGYAVDRNPYKHGKLLPGTHIPVFDPARIEQTKPDYILILPWNLREEISTQLEYVRSWGAKFVVPIPRLEVF